MEGSYAHMGKCYIFSTDYKTYDEAQAACREIGGFDLAVIDDIRRARFAAYHAQGGNFWMGLRYQEDVQRFAWANGAHLDFTRWDGDSPNDEHVGHHLLMGEKSYFIIF